MKTLKKILSAVLAVVMVMSIAVTAFAADYSFAYYFANEDMDEIYVTAFKGEVPADGYVEIPDEIDGYKVVGIAEHTFDNLLELKGVSVSEDVTFIDEDAFYGCNDVDVQVRVEVEEEEEEFVPEDWYEDHKQDYVIEGDTLVAYKGTDDVVTIPYNCSTVAAGAFKNNKGITTIYIPKELKVIGESAFEGCKYLADVFVANGVADIEVGKNAFAGTPWLENYPSEFVSIGTTLVKYKGELDDVTIPNVFKRIAPEAFYVGEDRADVISFKLKVPMSVEYFGEDCFFLYDSLTAVYPEMVVYKDSAADKYLHEAGIDHVYRALPGDVIFDDAITAADARYVLRIAAKLEQPVQDADLMSVADISGDNKIAAEDARLVLRIAARLDDYSVDQLLSMPRTDYEVLLTAANALSLARAYGCAYSKYAYQNLNNINVNTNSKTYFDMYNKELTSQKKAQVVTYNQDSVEAYENLFDITLIDASKIKSYSCAIKDGMYNITIVLNPETVNGDDVTADTFTGKMFPAETVAHFTSKAQSKYWYNDSIDYTMTYRDCTLKLTAEVDTLKVASMDVQMNYDFSITGKIMGIGIKGSNGPATATRTDVIKYTNFVYFTK